MSDFNSRLARVLPAWQWLRKYNTETLKSDLLSAFIVIAMLVPQGMAYAMLAGLPPVMGLYASVIPMIMYALVGGSPTLSIGPVAIISMMTFATLNPLFEVGSAAYIQAACLLAVLVGIISLLLGILRFGFLIQLISHPVIKSFIIASALMIAIGQLKFVLDIPLKANNLPEFLSSFWQYVGQTHVYSVFLGIAAILFLIYAPKFINSNAIREHVRGSGFILKALPLVLVIASIALVYSLHLQQVGIKTVGEIPAGFPPIQLPEWNTQLVLQLLPGAAMIAMISFVESLSIAQATALQKRSHLNSNQELIALGLAILVQVSALLFPSQAVCHVPSSMPMQVQKHQWQVYLPPL